LLVLDKRNLFFPTKCFVTLFNQYRFNSEWDRWFTHIWDKRKNYRLSY